MNKSNINEHYTILTEIVRILEILNFAESKIIEFPTYRATLMLDRCVPSLWHKYTLVFMRRLKKNPQ